MSEPPSPSPLSDSNLDFTHSSSTMSTNSSLLDIPSSIYILEDGPAKSSAVSFDTTGESETRPNSPIPYDDIVQEHNVITRQISQSPTMLLQLRARSKSFGMMTQPNSDILDSNSVITPSSTPPMSLSLSARSSTDQFPDIPTPSYEESISSPRLGQFPSIETLDNDIPVANGDGDTNADEVESDEYVENNYLPAPRHPIQRRDEEGNETLPDYSCSVFRSAIVYHKLECVYPGLPAKKREWIKVYSILFGTVMRVYLIQPDGSISINFSLDNPYREYTLQYAEAGIATDYVKRKYVLRVRAEGEQFLMQCANEEQRDAWVEAVQAGSSIALALEDRNMPKHITLPRRRRGRYSTSVSRSRPTVQRTQVARPQTPILQTAQSAPAISHAATDNRADRTTSGVTTGSEDSMTSSCNGEAPLYPYFDDATALAFCLDAGRSRPPPRERILISMLTGRQHRQYGWVIINGVRRKINPKTEELEDAIPEGVDPVEDEHRARLMKLRQRISSSLFKIF
jgi:hypothetical protein